MVPEKKQKKQRKQPHLSGIVRFTSQKLLRKTKRVWSDFFFLMGAGRGTGKHGPYGKDRA